MAYSIIVNNMLKEIGIILYWAEGSKAYVSNGKKHERLIEFANTDPLMITTFLRFLREIMKLEETRLRARIKIHQNINYKKSVEYWSKITGIPYEHFTKPIIRNYDSKKPNPENTVLTIRYTSKRDFVKLMGWINEVKNLLGDMV